MTHAEMVRDAIGRVSNKFYIEQLEVLTGLTAKQIRRVMPEYVKKNGTGYRVKGRKVTT